MKRPPTFIPQPAEPLHGPLSPEFVEFGWRCWLTLFALNYALTRAKEDLNELR